MATQSNRAPMIETVQADISNPVANIAFTEQIKADNPDNNPIVFSLDKTSRDKSLAIDDLGRFTRFVRLQSST